MYVRISIEIIIYIKQSDENYDGDRTIAIYFAYQIHNDSLKYSVRLKVFVHLWVEKLDSADRGGTSYWYVF